MSLSIDVGVLSRIMDAVQDVIFPGYFSSAGDDVAVFVEEECKRIRGLFVPLIGERLAEGFVKELAEVGRLVNGDVDAIVMNDPAVEDRDEVIYCYPGVKAMVHYRAAHVLHEMGVRVIPRIITEMAHSATGIDINPAARIGEAFAIDHGTGIVIGATCVIGNHVTLYQGVTLGAKNFLRGDDGAPLDVPRHPIIEDYVTIYSNTSVLGRVTIGHHSVIGGNVWLTHDVEPYTQIVQHKEKKI